MSAWGRALLDAEASMAFALDVDAARREGWLKIDTTQLE